MIKIDASKFGSSLLSRPAGREAALELISNVLRAAHKDEVAEIDFNNIMVLTPSWADEFFSVLKEKWGDRIKITATKNASVELTLKTIGTPLERSF